MKGLHTFVEYWLASSPSHQSKITFATKFTCIITNAFVHWSPTKYTLKAAQTFCTMCKHKNIPSIYLLLHNALSCHNLDSWFIIKSLSRVFNYLTVLLFSIFLCKRCSWHGWNQAIAAAVSFYDGCLVSRLTLMIIPSASAASKLSRMYSNNVFSPRSSSFD